MKTRKTTSKKSSFRGEEMKRIRSQRIIHEGGDEKKKKGECAPKWDQNPSKSQCTLKNQQEGRIEVMRLYDGVE